MLNFWDWDGGGCSGTPLKTPVGEDKKSVRLEFESGFQCDKKARASADHIWKPPREDAFGGEKRVEPGQGGLSICVRAGNEFWPEKGIVSREFDEAKPGVHPHFVH